MTVDREQIQRDDRTRKIVHVLCNCECRHAQTGHEAMRELAALLAELEQAERERDEARKSALAFEKWAEEETGARDKAEAQLAKVPALVEALRDYLASGVTLCDFGSECDWPDECEGCHPRLQLLRDALADWEKPCP